MTAGQNPQEKFQYIRSLDLRNMEIESIRQELYKACHGYRITIPRIMPGTTFYRGRKVITKPVNIKEVTYPPPEIITQFQRANRPGTSLFYCASGRAIPLYECGVQAGDKFVMSRWKNTAKMTVNHIGYTEGNLTRLHSRRMVPKYAEVKSGLESDPNNVVIREFLSEVFSEVVPEGQEYRFKLTIAIAEWHMCMDFIHGIMYPTIPMKGNGENFALKTDFVDEHMELVKVDYREIVSSNEDEVTSRILDTATEVDEDGMILWKGRDDQWRLTNSQKTLIFTAEKGEWVARDENGNIVEPE